MSTTEYRAGTLATASRARRLPGGALIARISPAAWSVGALTLLAAALRFPTIATQSYWADEALTAHEVHLQFAQMWTAVSHLETTPPLYFVVAWAWVHILGPGPTVLRSLSAVAGVAIVPIAYLCGRDLVSRRAGVIAAAFATLSPFLIWYSQEARAYMLLMALSGASFLWFIRAERDPSRRNIAWWALFSALALTTHFFAGFLVAPEALWLLWRGRDLFAFAAVGAVAAVQAALVPLARADTAHGIGWIHGIPRVIRIDQLPVSFGVANLYREVTISEGLWSGGALIGVVILLLVFGGRRAERRGALIAGAIAAVVFVAPLVIGLIRPADDFFYVRNLSPAWVPVAVMVAAACSAPRARDAGMVVASVLLVLFVYATIVIQTNPAFQRSDWRGVAHAIGSATGNRAILVVGGGYNALPLKVLLPGVAWIQPPATQRLVFDQVAIVTSLSRSPLRGGRGRRIFSLPRTRPHGAVFLGRTSVVNFVVARYALLHALRVDTHWMAAAAGRFFVHVPADLTVFVQRGPPAEVPALPPARAIPAAPGAGIRHLRPVAAARGRAHGRIAAGAHRRAHHRSVGHRRRRAGRYYARAATLTVEGTVPRRCTDVGRSTAVLWRFACWHARWLVPLPGR